MRALAGGIMAFICGGLAAALLSALKKLHNTPEQGFDLLTPLAALFAPQTVLGWTQLSGVVLFSAVIALATAATFAARSGRRPPP